MQNEFRLTVSSKSVNEGFARVVVSAFVSPPSGVMFSHASMGSKRSMLATVRHRLIIPHNNICVANDLRVPGLSPAPMRSDVITQKPAVDPNANCRKINISDVESFIPATLPELSVCPHIAASLIVYIC